MLRNSPVLSSEKVSALHVPASVSHWSPAHGDGTCRPGSSALTNMLFYKGGEGLHGRQVARKGEPLGCSGLPRKLPAAGRAALLPAGVVEGFEGPEVPPCWGKAILQELPAAQARGLEQLYVTS